MSYISALFDRKQNRVVVWERNNGNREIKTYPVPLYFYTESSNGNYLSIHGKKLQRHNFNSWDEFVSGKQKQGNKQLYESDIPPEIKVLSEHYYNATPPTLNITLLDIEVDYNTTIGFASTANPYAPINAVALHHVHKNHSIVIAVPPSNWDKKSFDQSLEQLSEIVLVKNEKELLLLLLEEIEETDILSGWNSSFFDIPYIAKRIEKTLGKSWLRKLSFEEGDIPRFREVEIFNNVQITCDLSGRVHLDYMDLFKKYEVVERQSYKLESIAEEILPDLPKLKYEGSLADLYKNDFNYFLRYNIRDTEILKGFEEKLGYIALANVMCHTSTAQFRDVFGTLKLTDYAIINYCHYELDVKVPDWKESENIESAQGAYVLHPQVGMHEWIGLIDVNSLYPNSLRSINISPETFIGQFVETEQALQEINASTETILTFESKDKITEQKTAKQWKEWLIANKYSISGYGTVFDQSKGPGVLPSILAEWYAKRKHFQKLRDEAKQKREELDLTETSNTEVNTLYNKYKDEEIYYDKLQYVYKIKLNSAYGAFLNQFFRFYDSRFGNSTTATGRMILQHQARKVSELLDGIYDFELPTTEEIFNKNPDFYRQSSVIYCDTDSVYFKTHAKNQKQAIMIADTVAEKVNKSFPEFMKKTFLCNPGFDTLIKSGRELVSDRGIFIDKKRYVLHVIDQDGHAVDKMKVMGLELKKTTLPKPVAKRLSLFIEQLLKGEKWEVISKEIVDFKDELAKTGDIMLLGLPKGIKGIEEYTQKYNIDPDTRLPGHVAASIFWNKQLKQHNDKQSLPINSNMKIKVFYLTKEFERFKSIAIPTDSEIIPQWFKDNFLEYIDRDAQIQRLVDDPLQHIFTAIQRQVPSRQTMFLDNVLEF